MAAYKDESLHLIDLLIKVKDKIGVPNLKKHLSDLHNKTVSVSEEKAQKEIIKAVANNLKVKPEFLTDGEKYSHDENKYWGITYICVFLNVHLKYKSQLIAPIFKMKDKNIYSRIDEFNKLERENKWDAVRLEVYDKIEGDLISKKIISKKKN